MNKQQILNILNDTVPDVSYETENGKYIFGFTKEYISELLDKLNTTKATKTIHLEWNVYYYSDNHEILQLFNVFSHTDFYNDIIETVYNPNNKITFASKVRESLQYHFSWKEKYQIHVSNRQNTIDSMRRIDIYDQIMLNFDRFIDYLWNFANISLE